MRGGANKLCRVHLRCGSVVGCCVGLPWRERALARSSEASAARSRATGSRRRRRGAASGAATARRRQQRRSSSRGSAVSSSQAGSDLLRPAQLRSPDCAERPPDPGQQRLPPGLCVCSDAHQLRAQSIPSLTELLCASGAQGGLPHSLLPTPTALMHCCIQAGQCCAEALHCHCCGCWRGAQAAAYWGAASGHTAAAAASRG